MSSLFLHDAEATDAMARSFAAAWRESGDAVRVIYLHGELGVGKSSFARALLRALGVQGAIKSPTYTLIERYPMADGSEAVHLDLYRLADAGELDFLALDELASCRLWLVEWPERGVGHLPAADLSLQLGMRTEGRAAQWRAHSPAAQVFLSAWRPVGLVG